MHAYRRFVEDQMDERHWTRADLARHSGLSKQTISNIVNDKREKLGSPPDDKTVDGLARAFSTSRDKVLAHVALAMGLPVSIERADVREVSDADLLLEVRRRMEARHDREGEEESGQEAGGTLNRGQDSPADGGTPSRPGAPISDLEAERDRRQQEADEKPLEDLLGLAADKGDRMDQDDAE